MTTYRSDNLASLVTAASAVRSAGPSLTPAPTPKAGLFGGPHKGKRLAYSRTIGTTRPGLRLSVSRGEGPAGRVNPKDSGARFVGPDCIDKQARTYDRSEQDRRYHPNRDGS